MTDAWTDPADEAGPSDGGDVTSTEDEAVDEAVDQTEAGIPDEPEVFVEEIEAAAVFEEQVGEQVGEQFGEQFGEHSQVAPDLPETGDPRVDEVVAKLAGISGRPTTEHVGVYDEVHRGLQDALANLDQG